MSVSNSQVSLLGSFLSFRLTAKARKKEDEGLASLFLKPVFPTDAGIKEKTLRLIFRFNHNPGITTLAIIGLFSIISFSRPHRPPG